jgi:hypothetical protein
VSVEFSEPMDITSAQKAFSLGSDTTYTVEVGRGAMDVSGIELAAPFISSFTTRKETVHGAGSYEIYDPDFDALSRACLWKYDPITGEVVAEITLSEEAIVSEALDLYVSGATVYAAGNDAPYIDFDLGNYQYAACYWEVGESNTVTLHSLSDQDSSSFASFLRGTDLYLAGYDRFRGCYRKNGVIKSFALPGQVHSSGGSIFVAR